MFALTGPACRCPGASCSRGAQSRTGRAPAAGRTSPWRTGPTPPRAWSWSLIFSHRRSHCQHLSPVAGWLLQTRG